MAQFEAKRGVILRRVLLGAALVAACSRRERSPEIAFNGLAFVQRDLAYGTSSPAQRFDLYTPSVPAGRRPLLVHVHGGGWMAGKKNESASAIAPYLSAGWAVADVEYRLGFEASAPAAVHDVACAVRRIPQMVSAKDVRTDSVTLVGESAGGHLVLMAAMTALETPDSTACGPRPPIRGVIAWAPPTDVPDLLTGANLRGWAVGWIGGDSTSRIARAKAVSPVHLARAGLPPVLLVHGDSDRTVPYAHATQLVLALQAAGSPVTLITLPGEDHSDIHPTAAALAWSAVLRFLAQPR